MTKGRPPKPTVLKELAGTARNDRKSPNEPQFEVPVAFPNAPDFMTEGAKEIWYDLGTRLLGAGLFTTVDNHAFSMFCVSADRWIEAERKITEMNIMLETEQDNGAITYRVNPYMSIANKSWDQMKKMFSDFGLTPSERSRLIAIKPDGGPKSLADRLFNMTNAIEDDD